jgi:hypothetical protein
VFEFLEHLRIDPLAGDQEPSEITHASGLAKTLGGGQNGRLVQDPIVDRQAAE